MIFDIIIFVLFVAQSNSVISTDIAKDEYRSTPILTTDDSMLVGRTIHKRKATDIFECSLCLIADQCKSFNFNEATGDCHLNGKRAQDKELEEVDGFIYGEKDLCETNPCVNGGKCGIQDDRQDYQCRCNSGFSGKNCQNNELGNSALAPAKTCLDLKKKRPSLPTGNYWIDPDEADPSNAFHAYCDMETDGGGWTLVWAYTFTSYIPFRSISNAVTPTPKNYVNTFGNISETAPKNETDFNALDFLKWRQIGSEVFMKSNINNWIACLPNGGSFVIHRDGPMKCRMIKQIASICSVIPEDFLCRPYGCCLSNGFNIYDHGYPYFYYFYDTDPASNWPIHDPCGRGQTNHLKNVTNPHGNIYLRRVNYSGMP